MQRSQSCLLIDLHLPSSVYADLSVLLKLRFPHQPFQRSGKSLLNRNDKNTILPVVTACWQCLRTLCVASLQQTERNMLSVYRMTAGHFIYVNTQKQHAAGHDKDVTRDKVTILTSGPNYICQSHTRLSRSTPSFIGKKRSHKRKM